jgi:transcriptional regulator with XRE-family HTH domain
MSGPATPVEPISIMIRRARVDQGLSQPALADRLSAAARGTVTRNEISRWERGERVPGRYWRHHLAAVLRVPVGELAAAAGAERRYAAGLVSVPPAEAMSAPALVALRLLAALGMDGDLRGARVMLAAAVGRHLPQLSVTDLRAVLAVVGGRAAAGSDVYVRDEPEPDHGPVPRQRGVRHGDVVDGSGVPVVATDATDPL